MAKKEFTISEYNNFLNEKSKNSERSVKKRDNITPIKLSSALQKTTGFSSIPQGHIYMTYGLSNSGKTSLMLEFAKCAQHSGIVPVFIITENKLDWKRVEKYGIDISENACIIEQGMKNLEDTYNYISSLINDVKNGRLPFDIMIFWDSVSNLHSKDAMIVDEKTGEIERKWTNQKNAQTIGYYNTIISQLINSSTYEPFQNSISLFMVAQAYEQPLQYPPGAKTLVPNGGEKIWYPISLSFRLKEKMDLELTVSGRSIKFGSVTAIEIDKNHITDYSCEGLLAILSDRISFFDKKDKTEINNYIKENKSNWIVDSSGSDSESEEIDETMD